MHDRVRAVSNSASEPGAGAGNNFRQDRNMRNSGAALPVAIEGLTKKFGAVTAVDAVSFDVEAGEFITLLGPSGSGKTTLLMMLAGFSRPSAGSIRIADQEIVRLPPHKRDIGMVFQNYALFPHMTVGENIAYPLKLRRYSRADIQNRVAQVLDLVQLGGFASRRVDELSGGQRQRIALARAIVFEPRILLMDEPLSALDKQLRETMQIEIRRLHDRLGMTTIAVTHDQREALTMSDRVVVLHHGKLMQLAAPRDLYEHPANRFVAEFIGESSFLPAETRAGAVYCGNQALKHRIALSDARRDMLLVLRPEKLEMLDGTGGDDDINPFDGTVTETVFQGESILLGVTIDQGAEVQIRLPNRRGSLDSVPAKGARVTLGLHASDVRLVPARG